MISNTDYLEIVLHDKVKAILDNTELSEKDQINQVINLIINWMKGLPIN